MKPDKEGVWLLNPEQPPIVVMTIYGEWKWRQIGCDDWDDLDNLKEADWTPLWTVFEKAKA